MYRYGWKYWALVGAIGLCVAVNSVAIVRSEPARVSPEFQDGFCAGWNAAQSIEAQRANNWRALIMVGRTEGNSVTEILVNSVASYVLIQPLQGPVTVDGKQVDCTSKAPPAADPPKPAPVPDPKKP